MSPQADFAVVTISFNQARYIQEAIESVLAQDVKLDYCVVDAGSKDNSREIIKRYSGKLKILFEPDDGPADGLNKGFRQVKGDYYYYLNADDVLLPGTFSFAKKVLKDPAKSEILMGGIVRIDENGAPIKMPVLPWNIDLANIKNNTYCVCQQGTIFTRGAWATTRGFNVKNRTCWDTEILVDALNAGSELTTRHRIFAYFRIHSQSITGTGGQANNPQYLRDHRGIEEKIQLSETPEPYLGIKKLLFSFNPIRRAWQIFIFLMRWIKGSDLRK